MLDLDLAKLYQVETKRINEAVKNNPEKFPIRFSFILDDIETENLRSKISTSSLENNYGGWRYNSRVFTEQGIYICVRQYINWYIMFKEERVKWMKWLY